MAGHKDACSGSAYLCDDLCNGLRSKILNLKCEPTPKTGVKCKLFANNGNVFAYVDHYKNRNEIKIWCRGESTRIREIIGGEFTQRATTSGGWESSFTGNFRVTEPSQIPNAVRVLFECAYVQRVESNIDSDRVVQAHRRGSIHWSRLRKSTEGLQPG
jgi:hypothetical protein